MTDDLGIPSDYAVKRRVKPQAEATDLVSVVASSDKRMIRLAPEAAAAWKNMRDFASSDGIALEALSGFRSIERQAEIIRGKLKSGEKIEVILQTVAAPGFSEHHTGSAIDIGVPGDAPLTEAFAQTPAFQWLKAHAYDFGFKLSYPKGNRHGFAFEPWHWFHEKR
jgi:zinc D-Ala-D-Ala carboxypeptidase